MKFFIDTANIDEIKEAQALGMVDGVTTNPSLVAKEGKEFRGLIKEICAVVAGPISVEVVSLEAEKMVAEAQDLAGMADNIVIKVPLIEEGLKAVKVLTEKGIKTNMTLCFSPVQALMAAKVGATYISPFIGRLDDISSVGMDLVEQIAAIYENYAYETEIIVASVRNPIHVLDAALVGADIATIPLKVIRQLIKHPLTDIGLENFLADWKKIG
ncbi:MAG: fructose-6-phosphate aldolase [Deltaproteobacteria bacterium]|nr:fructose-6-phosphate aldolase [Deltaproteobacteria bacterium]